MILRNLYSVSDDKIIDIHVSGGTIVGSKAVNDGEQILEFSDAIVFPGLINSHDHLDFNLFPRLGNRVYKNYVEWSHDIQRTNRAEIDKVLKIPKNLRIRWGIYKNLLAGVTTVVNHGAELPVQDDLINVFQQCYSLHSIQLEPHWKRRLLKPFRNNRPFAIHIGEGTDETAKKEISTLIRWNLLQRELIGIHGVAMDEQQAKAFKALVWCPDSNYFLVGKKADIRKLKRETIILFGTDSTLSADWDIWMQVRLARSQEALNDAELFRALTSEAAKTWGMKCKGALMQRYDADIVIARKNSERGMDAFYKCRPEDILIVMRGGKIKLFDESMVGMLQAAGVQTETLSRVSVNGSDKYVLGDLSGLMEEIKQYNPDVKFPVQ